MAKMLKVYFIILNWNSSDETIKIYRTLSRFIQEQKNWHGSIIVIDNDSVESQKSILKENIPSNNYLQTGKNLGYAGGNNIGISKALNSNADYVCLLNPDIELREDIITSLLNTLENDCKIAAIGPRICDFFNPDIIYSDGGVLEINNNYQTDHINNNRDKKIIKKTKREVDYVNGSAIVFRKDALIDVGLLNESFFLYFEETEWCLRARNKHWNLVVDSNVEVFHKPSQKGKNYHFFMTRNRIWLSKMYGGYKDTRRFIKNKIRDQIKYRIKHLLIPNNALLGMLKGFVYGVFFNPKD